MEQPVKTLTPINRMPFSLVIFLRLLVLIPVFGMAILMVVTGIAGVRKGDIIELPTLLLGIAFFTLSGYFLLSIFVLNKLRIQQLEYRFYPDRLVLFNRKKNRVLHDLPFDSFPEFTFHENLNNFGYIAIGRPEPLMKRGGLFGQNAGINLKDPEIMLENLRNVKQEYLFLKELIEQYRNNPEMDRVGNMGTEGA